MCTFTTEQLRTYLHIAIYNQSPPDIAYATEKICLSLQRGVRDCHVHWTSVMAPRTENLAALILLQWFPSCCGTAKTAMVSSYCVVQ